MLLRSRSGTRRSTSISWGKVCSPLAHVSLLRLPVSDNRYDTTLTRCLGIGPFRVNSLVLQVVAGMATTAHFYIHRRHLTHLRISLRPMCLCSVHSLRLPPQDFRHLAYQSVPAMPIGSTGTAVMDSVVVTSTSERRSLTKPADQLPQRSLCIPPLLQRDLVWV